MRHGVVVSVACFNLTATPTRALPAYDGLWSVLIVTEEAPIMFSASRSVIRQRLIKTRDHVFFFERFAEETQRPSL
jgi:hypothetical protein